MRETAKKIFEELETPHPEDCGALHCEITINWHEGEHSYEHYRIIKQRFLGEKK